jgi:hypothetical protein
MLQGSRRQIFYRAVSDIPKFAYAYHDKEVLLTKKNGRDERIRTSDHTTPSRVRYQTALHPESKLYFKCVKLLVDDKNCLISMAN